MVIVLDNFCNDKKVMNLNYYWLMEVFLLYMFILILGVEKVSVCVEVFVFLVVLVCR